MLNILHYISGLAIDVAKVGNCGRAIMQDVHTLGLVIGRVVGGCFTTRVLQLREYMGSKSNRLVEV